MPASIPFPILLTADFMGPAGEPKYRDIGLEVLSANPSIVASPCPGFRPEIGADQLSGASAALVLAPRVSAASLAGNDDLLVIARFGVGYDSVDVAACTRAGVLVTITAGAVDRPVAEATVGWMLALTHRVLQKDRLVRTGDWDARSGYMGCELRERTLGVVGLGGIGRALVRLLSGFGMNPPLAFDPFLSDDAFEDAGVRRASLDELLANSDFVSVHCPLTEQTRGLIGAPQIARMKPSAFLLNTARGGIVDEEALEAALREGRIAGAALDCFEGEPVRSPSRFAAFENVLLAPHCIAWTDELFRDIGRMACGSILDVSLGRRPHGLLNPQLLSEPDFKSKWRRVTGVQAG